LILAQPLPFGRNYTKPADGILRSTHPAQNNWALILDIEAVIERRMHEGRELL
jgi:hypothetical protein